MEFFFELLATVVVPLLLAFVLAKLIAFGSRSELQRDSAEGFLSSVDSVVRDGPPLEDDEDIGKAMSKGDLFEAEVFGLEKEPRGDLGLLAVGLERRWDSDRVATDEDSGEVSEPGLVAVLETKKMSAADLFPGERKDEECFRRDVEFDSKDGRIEKVIANDFKLELTKGPSELQKDLPVDLGLEKDEAKSSKDELGSMDIGEKGQVDQELVKGEESLPLKESDFNARMIKEEATSTADRFDAEVVSKEGVRAADSQAEKGSFLDDEDEWEGIERSELEKKFCALASMVASGGGSLLEKISDDVQLQLYGLHKVATEGPCYQPQPSMLNVSARVRWHAWQRLGNMNPEVAMEQYINLLSDRIPKWTAEKPDGNELEETNDSLQDPGCSSNEPDSSSSMHPLASERKREEAYTSMTVSDAIDGRDINE